MLRAAILILSTMLLADAVSAHSGGLDAKGCHHDRKRGGYHCHRGNRSSGIVKLPGKVRGFVARATGGAYYPNCSAARAAGAVPIRRGEDGYSRKLDRDNDGVACE